MILNKKAKNRLGIYYFKDKDGIFDSSYAFLLEKISKHFDKLVFVYNGELSDISKKKILKFTDIILKCEKGYRPNAYKLGYNFLSTEEKEVYDEILFFDNSLLGPFYSLDNMFDSMDKKDIDFWGLHWIYKHEMNIRESVFHKKRNLSVMPSFLTWSFFAVRSPLINSKVFMKFISSITYIKEEGRSDFKFNIKPTSIFMKKGFKCASYLSTDDIKDYSYNPLLTAPYISLKEKQSPFLYSELFYMDMTKTLEYTLGQYTIKTFEYIKENLKYDENLIWDNILRVANQHDIKNALGLTYMLPSDYDIPKKENHNKQTVALCMHLYYPDLFKYCLNYAKSMPKETHVFLTTNNEEKKKEIEKVFSTLICEKLEVRVIGNRGRDVSSLLLGCRDVVADYDIICYAHDKKTSQFSPYCVGETFSYQCFENILKSQNYVNNIIRTFESNSRLGILSPTLPFHAGLFTTIGREWILNFENTKELAKKCNVNVLIEENKPPLAPLGTMFWFRGDALLPLCDNSLTYEDFPTEPNDTNGTLLHAYERLYPYVVQNEGYFAGHVIADTYATLQMNSQYHMLRSISGELLNLFGLRCDDFNKVMHDINTRVHVVPNKSIYTLFKEYLFQALSPEKVKKIKELKSKISIRKKRI